ncbi:MAG: peptidase M19 [Flammeovirgaceae bacterium]|nr:peptidase M19 [Flammeovirgaceae bacterium]HCX24632.1 peptidase M19 [Cytophagales bacterium]|tara:strand:+ start:1642 stop:2898 length:1257 start_codon:yes stop_codon:yes gene_type:complete
MQKILSLGLVIAMLASCSPAKKEEPKKDISTMSEEEIQAYADELAHKFIIVDGHVDLPYRMEVKGFMLRKEVEDVSVETAGNFDFPKARKGGLDAPFMSIYVPSSYNGGGAKEFADSLITMTLDVAKVYDTLFAPANTPAEIQSNFEKGLISLPLGMENGAPIEDDLANVKYFFERGIRYITLTHSKDNQISDSSYDTTYTWNGVSPFGEQVIAEMNKWGIMVDISHVTDSAFYDAIKLSKAPVIASHSSCRYFTPGFHRNMSDQMIKDLAANGGVIHINFGSTFLSKESRDKFNMMDSVLTNYRAETGLSRRDSAYTAYAEKFAADNNVFADVPIVADHIDRVVELAGIDYVGFGSDFDGVGNSLPVGLKDVSMFPNILAELLKRGYSEEDIEKLCYKNTFRVWNEVIATANELQGK